MLTTLEVIPAFSRYILSAGTLRYLDDRSPLQLLRLSLVRPSPPFLDIAVFSSLLETRFPNCLNLAAEACTGVSALITKGLDICGELALRS